MIIGGFIILIISLIIVKSFDSKEKEELPVLGLTENKEELVENEDEYKIVIHITGEVNNEGVIKINEGDRISDAIEEAGGLTEEADIDRINLAYQLEDGQKIYIPNKNDKEIEEYIEDGVDEIVLQEYSENTRKSNIININKADVEELQSLNGIGESLAESIIAYRDENGKFKKVEDIKNVTGIGESKYEKIKDSIKVK